MNHNQFATRTDQRKDANSSLVHVAQVETVLLRWLRSAGGWKSIYKDIQKQEFLHISVKLLSDHVTSKG